MHRFILCSRFVNRYGSKTWFKKKSKILYDKGITFFYMVLRTGESTIMLPILLTRPPTFIETNQLQKQLAVVGQSPLTTMTTFVIRARLLFFNCQNP